jgi:hypothetical protein
MPESNSSGLYDFIGKVYSKKNSQWVPLLISNTERILSECTQKSSFLAYDDNDDVISRIVAIIDYNYITFQDDKREFFCWRGGGDIPPNLMVIYASWYYLCLVEQHGLKKIKELYAYDMDISEDSRIDRLERVVAAAKKKPLTLEIRAMQKSSFEEDLKSVKSIYKPYMGKN